MKETWMEHEFKLKIKVLYSSKINKNLISGIKLIKERKD